MTMRSTTTDFTSTNQVSTAEPSARAAFWKVDVPHSEVNFRIKHFFTPVTGTFRSYDIDLFFDRENPENSSVEVSIDVSSIDTGDEDRDAHLLSPDFFDAEEYPEITFESSRVEEVEPNELVAHGTLTIKGTSKQIELPIHFLGVSDLPDEVGRALGGIRQVASFESGLQLDRREFEVGVGSWAQTLVVGAEVDVSISVEANRR